MPRITPATGASTLVSLVNIYVTRVSLCGYCHSSVFLLLFTCCHFGCRASFTVPSLGPLSVSDPSYLHKEKKPILWKTVSQECSMQYAGKYHRKAESHQTSLLLPLLSFFSWARWLPLMASMLFEASFKVIQASARGTGVPLAWM